MIKKFAALLITAVLTLSFAACTAPGSAEKALTAEEIYLKAAEKQSGAETADMNIDCVINLSAAGESLSMNMSMRAKSDLSDKENVKLGMASKISMPNSGETEINYAYIGDTIYVETAGIKYKSAVTPEQAQEIMGSSSANEIMTADIIRDAELTKDGDNNIINFSFDESLYNDILKNSLGSLGNASGISYEFTEFGGSAVIDKDYNMKSLKSTVKAIMSSDGTGAAESGSETAETVEISMDMDIKINSVGEPVEITAPADAESYTEVSPDALTASAA